MNVGNWITIIVGIVAIIGLIGTASYRSHKSLTDLSKDGETKRGRIYQRIDEMKTTSDEKFVDEKVCKVRHEGTDRQLEQINTNVTNLTAKIDKLLTKNGISNA